MKPVPHFCVISSSGLCSHYLIKGFALLFESGDPVANNGQHVAIRDHFGFAADWATQGNVAAKYPAIVRS
jgi:hypothetical protein